MNRTREEWRLLRETPADWDKTVAFDKVIRNIVPKGTAYVHRDGPLDEVDLSTPEENGQGNLFWSDECEGHCGV